MWKLRVGALGVRRSQVEGTTYEKWHENKLRLLGTKHVLFMQYNGRKEYKREGYEREMWYPNLKHMFVPGTESQKRFQVIPLLMRTQI